jgi:hypothetical protein
MPRDNRIDAVLPLVARDVDRSVILRRSLRRFFSDLGTCWVVTPDSEREFVSSRISGDNFRVIPESKIVPELKFYNFIRKLFGVPQVPGWCVQQIIKLGIAPYVDSQFYLVLDSDVICVKRVRASELVRDGRARTKRYPDDIHREWYEAAERLLGLRRSGLTHSVTPCLLSKAAVLGLHDWLCIRSARGSRRLAALARRSHIAGLLFGWRSYLLRNLGWSEYALYHTYLEGLGLWEKFHYEVGDVGIAWNSVWVKGDFESWRPEDSFLSGDFFFSVVQSNTGVDVIDVWERVRSYLEL